MVSILHPIYAGPSDTDIAAAEAVIEAAEAARKKVKSESFVLCDCGRTSPISLIDITYIEASDDCPYTPRFYETDLKLHCTHCNKQVRADELKPYIGYAKSYTKRGSR